MPRKAGPVPMSPEFRWALSRIRTDLAARSAPSPFERYAPDPIGFVREALGEELWSRQREVTLSIRDHKRTAVKSGFGVGKSHTAARAAAHFLASHRDSIVFVTGPTFRQVKNVVWRNVRTVHRRGGLPGTCSRDPVDGWEIDAEWYAFGASPRDYDPKSIQGIHAEHVLVIIDEADGVPPQIWDACEGLIVGEHCRILAIGNPEDPTGRFADCFRSELWNAITISCFDSPNVTGEMRIPGLTDLEWIESQRARGMEGTPWWVSRVLGEFPEAGADTLISLRAVERALRRPELVEEGELPELMLPASEPVIVGVDVARFGPDDMAVAAMRGGRELLELDSRHGREITWTANRAAVMANKQKASRIRVDAVGGLGASVYDILLEKRRDGEIKAAVDPVYANDDAEADDQFFNLRSEMWWRLKEDLDDGEIDLSACPEGHRIDLIRDLTAPKYGFRKGRIYVEDKEDLRKRKVPSPDRADAIMLARAPATSGVVMSFLDDAEELDEEDDLDEDWGDNE